MALVIGTATVSVDGDGNVTLGGSDMALAWANALNPDLPTAQVLQYKAALGDDTKFEALIETIYIGLANKLAQIATYINANISGGGGGGITELTGDVAAGPGSGSQSAAVTGWASVSLDLTFLSPSAAQFPIFVGPTWSLVSMSGDVTIDSSGVATVASSAKGITQLTGDVTAGPGSGSQAGTVAKVKGTSISTAGGSLTTGTVLRATGTAAADWGAVDLANSNAVTGVLATGNQASQAIGGDGSGTTAALTVIAWRGKSLDATTMGAPADAQVPIWVNGSSAWKSLSLSGDATISNTGAVNVAKVNGTSVPASPVAGAVLLATASTTATWLDPSQGSAYQPFPILTQHKVRYFSGESPTNVSGSPLSGAHYWGFSALTFSGTATKPAFATTSKLTATTRLRYATTSAGSLCGFFESGYINAGVTQYGAWRGNAAGRGGFYFRHRFAIHQVGVSSTMHMFVGLAEANGSSSTDWTTDTTLCKLGIGFTGTTTAGGALPSANWQGIESAHSAPHLTNLGAGFPLTIDDFIEVIIYAAPNSSSVTLIVNNLTTGATTSQTLNTNLPTSTTPLIPIVQLGTQTITSGTNSIDVAIMNVSFFDG